MEKGGFQPNDTGVDRHLQQLTRKAKKMLIDEERVKEVKEAKIVIWCLHSRRAGAT